MYVSNLTNFFISLDSTWTKITISYSEFNTLGGTLYLGSSGSNNSFIGVIRKLGIIENGTSVFSSSYSSILGCEIGIGVLNQTCFEYQTGPSCITGEYLASQSGCLKCDYRCTQCSDGSNSNCAACFPPFSITIGSTCSCAPSKYPAIDYNRYATCLDCPTGCLDCNSTHCQSCITNYYLYNSSCYSTCPNLTGIIPSTSTCSSCSLNCLNCTYNSSGCISCFPGSYLYGINSSCIPNCPLTYHQNETSQECMKCNDSNCLECIEGPSVCSNCSSGYYLYNQACVESCPLNYGINSSSKACVNCLDSSCSNCSLNYTSCLVCDSSSFLFGVSCYSSCPIYTGISRLTPNECSNCSSSCINCSSNSSICNNCSASTFLYSRNSTCLSLCPLKYYEDTTARQCVSCFDTNCSQCSNDPAICQTCEAGFHLHLDYYCVEQCPLVSSLNATLNKCVLCLDGNCSDCSADYRVCSRCQSNFYLYKDVCFSLCPYLTGIDPSDSGKCQNCSSYCLNCSLNSSICTSCSTPTFLYSPNSTCLSSCPLRYSSNNQSNQCIKCNDSQCLSCTPDGSYCYSCDSLYYSYSGQCNTTCPSSYYPNATLGQCINCQDPHCEICLTTNLICDFCASGYYQLLNTCLASCPQGYYQNDTSRLCIPCPDAFCLNCSTPNQTCISCNTTKFLLNGSCVASCPTYKYFLKPGDNKCYDCDPSCNNCNGPSSQNCTYCYLGTTWLYQNACLSYCPSVGYYPDNTTSFCEPCHSSCYTCSEKTSKNCTSCINSYFLNSMCYNPCPDQYRNESLSWQCQKCLDPNCKTCPKSTDNCSFCLASSSMFVNDTKCIPACPPGKWTDIPNNFCQFCDPSCLTCLGPGPNNCSSCSSPRFLLQSTRQCVNNCPNGMYGNVTQNRTCMNCITNCLTCNDSSNLNCTTCNNAQNYYKDLLNGCWYASCGDGKRVGPLETCDDGNLISGDGCSQSCQTERGWYCDIPDKASMLSLCETRCGDGIPIFDYEECDDGNLVDGDGCSRNCTIEARYFCYLPTSLSASLCTCEPVNGTAAFDSTWDYIIISYNDTIDYADIDKAGDGDGLNATNCELLLDYRSVIQLGSGYTCQIVGKTIVIALGKFHGFTDLNSIIYLKPFSFIYSFCPLHPINYQPFVERISAGNYSIRPVLEIQIPKFVKMCEAFTLNVTASFGAGNATITGNWSLLSTNNSDASTIARIRQALSSSVSSSITIPGNTFIIPFEYKIAVTSNNFWGGSGNATGLINVVPKIDMPSDRNYPCRALNLITFSVDRLNPFYMRFRFNKEVINTTEELNSSIHFSVKDYKPNYFSHDIKKLDDFSVEVTFTFKRTIYNRVLLVNITKPDGILDKYYNTYTGPVSYGVSLVNVDIYSEEEMLDALRASQSAAAAIISTLVPILVFGSGPLILSFLDGAQVINYLKYINVNFPLNLEAFFSAFSSINFSFMPNLFEILLQKMNLGFYVKDQNAPYHFAKQNMTSMFLLNAGPFYFLVFIFIFLHFWIRFISKIPMKSGSFASRLMLLLRNLFEYNGYIMVMDSTYYQQGLAIFLQLRNISFSNGWNALSFLFMFLHGILYFGFPISIHLFLRDKPHIYLTKKSALGKKLGLLFFHFKDSKYTRTFYSVTLLRKMIHCFILVVLYDNIFVQAILLILMNVIYLTTLIVVRPYYAAKRLRNEILTEVSFLVLHSMVFSIYFYDSNQIKRFQIGWMVILACLPIISIHLLGGLKMMYVQILVAYVTYFKPRGNTIQINGAKTGQKIKIAKLKGKLQNARVKLKIIKQMPNQPDLPKFYSNNKKLSKVSIHDWDSRIKLSRESS